MKTGPKTLCWMVSNLETEECFKEALQPGVGPNTRVISTLTPFAPLPALLRNTFRKTVVTNEDRLKNLMLDGL